MAGVSLGKLTHLATLPISDYYFAFASLGFVSTLMASLANSLLPLFVGIATYFVNGEKLSWMDFVGASLIVSGMVTVVSAKGDGNSRDGRGEAGEDGKTLLEMEDLKAVDEGGVAEGGGGGDDREGEEGRLLDRSKEHSCKVEVAKA